MMSVFAPMNGDIFPIDVLMAPEPLGQSEQVLSGAFLEGF
jgi:hypothetical protein